MFADLSGYTAMNERMDPEDVEALMGRLKDEAVRIVESHGGIVNQFVGDEVLALFGIPTAHEDDPVRAVMATRELHGMVQRLSLEVEGRIGQPLTMHTGIHTGLIVTNRRDDRDGRYGVTGDTVNTAARLKAQAEAGDILVSSDTQQLLLPFFETAAVEALPLKGKASPVTAHRIVRQSAIHTRFEAAAHRGFTPYTGRDQELSRLEACLARARAGQGQFVTVMGEAGVGKSRLLHEFSRRLDRAAIMVVQGRCQSYGSVTSYPPFMDVLRSRLGLSDVDPPAALLETASKNILEIDASLQQRLALYLHLLSIPGQLSLPANLRGAELQHALQEALAAIITLQSQRQPTVLILEDWHWADAASDAALRHLIGVIASCPLMVLVTYRPDSAPHWGLLSCHTDVVLNPLDALDAEKIARSALGAVQLPAGLGELIHARTGGNPFFIEEACRALCEGGVVIVRDGWAALTQPVKTLTLPDTVQAILRTRLDRLDADVKEAVRLASVVGRTFSRRILERMYKAPTPLVEALKTLEAREIILQTRVLPEAEYSFKHVLTQEVAYETLLLQRRKVLHGLVGDAIEALYPDRLEDHAHLLQRHFSHAENWAKAVHHGLQTVKKAAKLSLFLEAAPMLDHVQAWASRLPEDQARQKTLIDILLQKERICEFMGWREQQQAIIDQLRLLLEFTEDRALLTEVLIRQGELCTHLGRLDEAERTLDDALAMRRALCDAAGESAALKSMGFLRLHQGLFEAALACNEAALAIDQQRGDAMACVTDLTNLGVVLPNLGEYERALTCLSEALQLCETMDDARTLNLVLYHMGHVHRKRGDVDRALAHYQRCYGIGLQAGHATWQALALEALAAVHWEQGSTEESLRLYDNAIQVIRRSHSKQRLSPMISRQAELLLTANRPRDAVPYLLEGAELFAELGDPGDEALVWERLANVYEGTMENWQRALEAWSTARALRTKMGDREGVLEALRQMARLAHHRLGEPTDALRYVRAALDLAVEIDDRPKQGELLSSAANLEWHSAAYADALTHYEEALRVYRELGDVPIRG